MSENTRNKPSWYISASSQLRIDVTDKHAFALLDRNGRVIVYSREPNVDDDKVVVTDDLDRLIDSLCQIREIARVHFGSDWGE